MTLTEPLDGRALYIALAPELLTAVVRSGARVLAHSEVRITADAEGSWDSVLAALRTYLRQAGPTLRGLPIALCITTRWCRLSMLPWSEALRHEDSAARHAHAHFEAIYGDAARHWSIVRDDAPNGQRRLAFAVERELVSALQDIALENGNPRIALESALSVAARALGPAQHAAMAVIEPGRLVLATLAQGRITAVESQDCRGPWHIELPKAWQRWRARMPAPDTVGEVAVVSLDQRTIGGELPPPFRAVALPEALAPAYAAVMMTGC